MRYRRNRQYIYLGQCDRLRMAGYEDLWQHLMHSREPLSLEEFELACEVETILDEDETLEEFVMGDPDSGFYRSTNLVCLYKQQVLSLFLFDRQSLLLNYIRSYR